VLHGRGRVRLGAEEHVIGAGDVVYVAPHEPHAFEASGDEPLGFLCVVPARR
jgi:quercetin dioxygenase-like cupin family protein